MAIARVLTKHDLFDEQYDDAMWMALKTNVLNASVMGTCKTATTLLALHLMAEKEKKSLDVVIICPAVAKTVWVEELQKTWEDATLNKTNIRVVSNGKDINPSEVRDRSGYMNVCIINYDYFSNLDVQWEDLVPCQAQQRVVILDEAHYVRNHASNRSQRIFKFTRDAHFVWALTGTPVVNHYGDMYPLARMLGVYNSSHEVWMEGFTVRQEIKVKNRYITIVKRSKNPEKLREMFSDIIIRRKPDPKKSKGLKIHRLPLIARNPQFNQNLPVPATGDTKVLQHAFNNPKVKSEWRKWGLAKVEPAFAWVTDFLEANPHEKLVIFGWHKDVIKHMEDLLAGYNPVKIDGATNNTAIVRHITRFQHDDKCRVFLGNIGACATAITLTRASTVLLLESVWNPSENMQAIYRVFRTGQKKFVNAYHAALVNCPFDDRMIDTLVRKEAEFDGVFK